ncbi:MAG: alpha-mannosidase, partial [bacterium]
MSWQGMKNLEKLHLNKIADRIREIDSRFIWTGDSPIKDVAAAECKEHLSFAEARKLSYKPVNDGFVWGQPWGTCWFRLRFLIPTGFQGQTVVLRYITGGECIIFRDGLPVQALDNGRNQYVVTDNARGGEKIELYVEAGASGSFGDFARRTMRQPVISRLNKEVWEAYWDLVALADMVSLDEYKPWAYAPRSWAMEPEDTRRARILFALNKAVDLFDYDNPSPQILKERALAVRRALKPIFASPACKSAQTIACLGHAHIDVAWLWPLAETERKCGRTFSNVLELMDHYPEFVFVQSQPHLYEFTKEKYPSVYRRIKEQVRKGKWVPTGAMWVETDCNVTSGESLVRQILFGSRFFKKEFNFDVKDVWIPDVFGYSAAMPQIIHRSGLSYFLTQKLSWSQFSKFPHQSFWWEGIDGTKVLSHFPPVETYNASLTAGEVLMAERRYRQKDRSSIQAIPYGLGDGGGGPTRAMIERMRRYRNLEGMPRLAPMSVKDFFARLEKESVDLPTWVGELYFELHRGTFTTQAYNKRNNRLAELGLRDAEMLSAVAKTAGGRYDKKRLHDTWKLVLLNQFHDILPGSSIDEVYKDCDRHYAEILKTVASVRSGAIEDISRKTDTRGEGIPVVALNTLGWERHSVVAVDGTGLKKGRAYIAGSRDGIDIPVQVGHDGKARFAGSLPPVGQSVFHIRPGRCDDEIITATTHLLENALVRAEFDDRGRLVRVFDKRAGREVLEPGAVGNRMIVFEDKMATCGPAWDVEIYYNDKPLEHDGALL